MVERTHTQERYRQRRSQTEKYAEKTEEHSSRRFTELPGRALNHTEGGPYNSKGAPSCRTDSILVTSSCIVSYS